MAMMERAAFLMAILVRNAWLGKREQHQMVVGRRTCRSRNVRCGRKRFPWSVFLHSLVSLPSCRGFSTVESAAGFPPQRIGDTRVQREGKVRIGSRIALPTEIRGEWFDLPSIVAFCIFHVKSERIAAERGLDANEARPCRPLSNLVSTDPENR